MGAIDTQDLARRRRRERVFRFDPVVTGATLAAVVWMAFREVARTSALPGMAPGREFAIVAFLWMGVTPAWFALLAQLAQELLRRERVPDRAEEALTLGGAVPAVALPLVALAWAWRSGWNPGNAVAVPVSIGVGAWTWAIGRVATWRLLGDERWAAPAPSGPRAEAETTPARTPGRGDAPVPTWTALAILLAGLAGLFGWAWCRFGGCPGAEDPLHPGHADLVLFFGLFAYDFAWTFGIDCGLFFSGRRGHEVDLGTATAWFWSRVLPMQVFLFFAVVGAKYRFFARIAVLLTFAWVALASILATRKMLAATRPRRP